MNFRRLKAVAKKEMLHIVRDVRSLYLALALPLIMLLLFGYALTLDVDRIPTYVYDQDRTPESRELIQQFRASRYFQILADVNDYKTVERGINKSVILLSIVVPRDSVVASNADIFILWMVGSSIVLIAVAILFLRNQVKPIERLALAADAFGKGRAVPDFKPYGATEVRKAAQAFITMRARIERYVQQRTEMLAGVSHDQRKEWLAASSIEQRGRRGGGNEARFR